MTQLPSNTVDSTTPRRSKATGWWKGLAALLILIGTVIVAYPFIPAIRFALLKPSPVLPYTTKLTDRPAGQTALAALPSLPVVKNKPVPSGNRIVIPSIGVDMPILEGPTQRVLDRGGIWHIPNTSDPIRGGNMVLSGHRWQYLPPSSTTLYLLDKVKDGEPIIVYWQGQEYDYRVASRDVVSPDRVEILNDTPQPKLTIFTCTPLFSTKQRLVLYGELIS
ncbi:MAG: class E sortase [Candidatus Kerfeldbacteria bacterium]|nr:class E sortase [Candidatus Kerfeldbacteria bacterium]